MADKLPPVDGFEYPEKPGENASMWEKMQYLEQVDRYWQKRAFQKLDSHNEDDESDKQ